MGTPSDYELPESHTEWRYGQEENIESILGMADKEIRMIEAPTGSGKTSLARATASQQATIALCKTKMLQTENYGENYGFDVLFGRGNYTCASEPSVSAAECEYGTQMHDCPWAGSCEYLARKKLVMRSNKKSLNYYYWLTARWPKQSKAAYVFLDECHALDEVVLGFAGATIRERERAEWGLPEFPRAITTSQTAMIIKIADPVVIAMQWLKAARATMRSHYVKIKAQVLEDPHDKAAKKRLKKCEGLGSKLGATLIALETCADDWYIRSGPNARKVGSRTEPGFVAKPLTAAHHFSHYFLGDRKIVMMSATVGDPKALASELGIDKWTSVTVPNQWPPEARRVYYFEDAPKLGMAALRKGDAPFEHQADLIVGALNEVPTHWSGVIHVSSRRQASALAQRMATRGFYERVWMPRTRMATDAQLAEWRAVKNRVRGALAITYSWHEGVDLLDEKICILAKIPFPYLGDPYERERQRYNGKFYNQRAAWSTMQSVGRTRRGREEDYDLNGKRRGLVLIADGNWVRVQKYLGNDFKESMAVWPS